MIQTTRKNYSKEFKVESVKLVTEQGYSISQAARPLGIHKSTLCNWKNTISNKGEDDSFLVKVISARKILRLKHYKKSWKRLKEALLLKYSGC